MFRKLRRIRQALSTSDCATILKKGTSGVLALSGDDGYPYAVPLSYVYDGSALYFPGAKAGHKLDAIRRDCRASFCVIDQDQIIPEKYTTYFRSVIVFGRMRILEEGTEKRAAIEKLAARYSPDEDEAARQSEIDREYSRLCMMALSIEHMTGKQAIELVRDQGEK